MKRGIDSYSFHLNMGFYEYHPSKPMSNLEFLDTAYSMGAQGVMLLNLSDEERNSEASLMKLVQKANDLELYLEFGSNGTDPKRLAEDLHLAHKLGAQVLKSTIKKIDRRSGSSFLEKQIREMVNDLQKVKTLARKLNIRIAMENHGELRAPEWIYLLSLVKSEYIGMCLDTGNSLTLMEDPLLTAEVLAPFAYTTHFKDCFLYGTEYGAAIDHVGLGKGILPLREILDIVKRRAPDPNINLEVVSAPRKTEEETLRSEFDTVADSMRYAREILGL